MEGQRKRLRQLEELEGATKCAKLLRQAQITFASSAGVPSTSAPPPTVAPSTPTVPQAEGEDEDERED